MKISGDWLERSETQAVLAMLNEAGHQALPVGGCVRNAILGVPIADVDISTDARPERVIALAKAAGLKTVPTGIEHGTVTVLSGGEAYEVTTFRRDVETNGRHAVVSFSDRIEEDAARRDFTMNALYVQADGTLVDPLGGLADAVSRRLRFVGDAQARIREDYLRILRFFRFQAYYGAPEAGIDPEGLAACAANSAGIETLSAERIWAELKKLLGAPDPAPVVAAMGASGVLSRVLQGADPRALPILIHLEAGASPDWLARLAVLGGEDPSEHLRLSRAESRDLGHVRAALGRFDTPAALAFQYGERVARAAVLARAAIFEQHPPLGWQDRVAFGVECVFPVKAKDLPELQGPALGKHINRLKRYWLNHDLAPSQADLLTARPEDLPDLG